MDYEGRLPGPVNLGNPAEYTVRELAELVLDRADGQRVGDRVAADQRSRAPSPGHHPREVASRLVAWLPWVPLARGCERTIAHYRSYL